MRLVLILILALGAGPIPPPQPPPAAAGAPKSLRVRLDEAKALLDRRANPEALKILQGLLPLAEADDDEALLFETVYQTARAYFQLSEYAPALQYSERALGLSRAQGSRAKEAQILRGIGQIHKSHGAYPQSLRASQESIAIYEEIGDRPGAARARLGVGAALDLMGEYGRALEAYEQARDVLADTKDASYDLLLNEIGITQANLVRFEEALDSQNRNLERRLERGDQYGQQLALHNLAEIHYELGQYERAIEHYDKALALGRLDKRAEGVTLGALAKAWNALGDHKRALDYSRQQLQAAREIDAQHVEGWALQRLGDTEGLLGDLGRSHGYYGQALDLWRRIGAQADEGVTLAALADLSLREGRVDEARPLAEEALALARQSRAPELAWQAHFLEARVARASGESERALASLRVAIDSIDSLRSRIFTDRGKIGYLEARQAVFGELVDLLSERGAAAQALEVSEDARSRAFRDLLAGRRFKARPDQDAALSAIRELEARLRAQEGSKPEDETLRAELAQTRAATERDLETRVRTLSSEEPELASLVVAESVTAEEIRAAARERQSTIVEYLVTESRLFIWVVSPAAPGTGHCEIEVVQAEPPHVLLGRSVGG